MSVLLGNLCADLSKGKWGGSAERRGRSAGTILPNRRSFPADARKLSTVWGKRHLRL